MDLAVCQSHKSDSISVGFFRRDEGSRLPAAIREKGPSLRKPPSGYRGLPLLRGLYCSDVCVLGGQYPRFSDRPAAQHPVLVCYSKGQCSTQHFEPERFNVFALVVDPWSPRSDSSRLQRIYPRTYFQ